MIAPGVVEVERPRALHIDVRIRQGCSYALLVVDDKAEVPGLIGGLTAPRREGDELVSHVDERHVVAVTSSQREFEEALRTT